MPRTQRITGLLQYQLELWLNAVPMSLHICAALLVILVVGVGWVTLPSGASGSFVLETAEPINVTLVDTDELRRVEGYELLEENTASQSVGVLVRTPEKREPFHMYLATDLPRAEVAHTFSHELDHYYLQREGLSPEEQHARIRDKYRVRVGDVELGQVAFWRWRPRTWSLLRRL